MYIVCLCQKKKHEILYWTNSASLITLKDRVKMCYGLIITHLLYFLGKVWSLMTHMGQKQNAYIESDYVNKEKPVISFAENIKKMSIKLYRLLHRLSIGKVQSALSYHIEWHKVMSRCINILHLLSAMLSQMRGVMQMFRLPCRWTRSPWDKSQVKLKTWLLWKVFLSIGIKFTFAVRPKSEQTESKSTT